MFKVPGAIGAIWSADVVLWEEVFSGDVLALVVVCITLEFYLVNFTTVSFLSFFSPDPVGDVAMPGSLSLLANDFD